MGVIQDGVLIKQVIKVLRDIEVRMGENELLNAIVREAQILIMRGEALLANSNPHVEDRDEFEKWARDCAELSDYINAISVQH